MFSEGFTVEYLRSSFEEPSSMLRKQSKKYFLKYFEMETTGVFSNLGIRTKKLNPTNEYEGVLLEHLTYPSADVLKRAYKKTTGYDPDDVKLGRCFIATATMGSYDHPKVVELRHFRDEWILTKNWGSSFVKWYYHYGEKAAKIIDENFVLKKISYLLIVKPLVYLSRIVKK